MLLVLFWGFIIGSGLLLIAAAGSVVGLISPRFGARLLGTMVFPQFDGHRV